MVFNEEFLRNIVIEYNALSRWGNYFIINKQA